MYRILTLLLLVSAAAHAQPADSLMVPPEWTDSLVYAQSFDSDSGQPEINALKLQLRDTLIPQAGGMHGQCGGLSSALGGKGRMVHLAGPGLSPQRPLTVMLWWSLPEDLPQQGGFGLIHLGGRGMISTFARGGPWCGLKESAGVVQVYSWPGIQNVNGIYDLTLHRSLGLGRGEWHHSALVLSAGSLVSAYTDGKLVYETRTAGRSFGAEDALGELRLGGGVLLDEILILSSPLTSEQIAEYITAMRQMKAAYGR